MKRGIIILLVFLGVGTGAAGAEEKGTLMVDRFAGGLDAKGIPVGWNLEKEPGNNSKITLEQEKERHFLRLHSAGDTFGLKKELSFDIRKYPYLSWRWRATKLPQGGDIRKRETDDQAGQIYVVFPKLPTMINSRSMGYIWDTQAPVGLSGTSTAYSKMKYVVLQSGPAKLDQWICETRNVYEDYQKLFQEEPPLVGTVLVYINSQHTKSSAACDYADLFFSASPPKKE
ncbi:MAG: DUF3047 domain-containing protein [Deltaproteobacteria bacterium]|nr:DUF3047 domain-containing protein [Deltaproteobacteria bacterium]